ncbi:hypothetical protein OSTOST_24954, partial [Ostertagia ostertagi]
MDFSVPTEQRSLVESPVSAQGNDQRIESDPAGSPLAAEEAACQDTEDPTISPVHGEDPTISSFLSGMLATVDEDEPMDLEDAIPAHHLADLLISADPVPTEPSPMESESQYVEPKSEHPLDSGLQSSSSSLDPIGAVAPPLETIGAVAPSLESIGAVAPQQDYVGADAPSSSDDKPSTSKFKSGGFSSFSYASVVARQQAAAIAQSSETSRAAPLPVAPAPAPRVIRRRPANHLTVDPRGQLPAYTPAGYSHRLIESHPWAPFISLRSEPFPSNPDFITAAMPLELYSHIPPGGYLSPKFVKRLFPLKFREQPSRRQRLSVIELMRLDHAVAFRRSSQRVIDDLLAGRYVITENSRPVTPEGTMPSITHGPRQPVRMRTPAQCCLFGLAAVNCINDDKRTHMLTAIVPSMSAFRLRFDFIIGDMSSECGWTTQRPVYLWVIGSRSLIRALIEQAEHSYEDRSSRSASWSPSAEHIDQPSRPSHGLLPDAATSPVCRSASSSATLPSGTDLLYELISKRQLFAHSHPNSQARIILDAVYGSRR